MFVYIRTNEWCDIKDVYKVGITKSIIDRNNTYITGEIIRGKFIKIFKLDISHNQLKNIDKIIKSKFEKLNVYHKGGGKEYYKKSINEELEKFFIKHHIKFELVNEEDLKRLNRTNSSSNKFIEFVKKYLEFKENEEYFLNILQNCDIPEKLRDYQELIVNQGTKIIKSFNKVYLSLATGGGKSKIAFSILNNLFNNDKHTIIILTPRINICNQNINIKYLKNLNNTYKIYNKDNLKNIQQNDYNIICVCINSYKKLVNIIISKSLTNIAIWFDEAHYGIDNWVCEISTNHYKKFLLNNNELIKYRLFTSASPDKDFISKYDSIFGELLNPIKVKDLINENWLCDLDVYIYKDELDEEISKIDIKSFIEFISNKFIENDKTAGLCFCNSCDNALELFKHHLEIYEKNKDYIIKPFLLLNNDKISEYYQLKEISYEYSHLFNIEDFNAFENGEKNTQKRIGYIVKMYSMGYDNRDIDFLVFKDPKMSHKDIIQSIGRGLRPDGLNIDGKNFNKRTDVIIPVYINDMDNAKKFDKIKEVLKYLLLDVELNMKQINFIHNPKKIRKSTKIIDYTSMNDEKDELIIFIKEIESIIYEICKSFIKWNETSIIRQLKFNDIHTYIGYLNYVKNNPQLNLPQELFKNYPLFNFNQTYKNNLSPYYSREDCIEMIKKYKRNLIYDKKINKTNNKELLKFLINIDNKIPNECLWTYYGGDKEDFIIFV